MHGRKASVIYSCIYEGTSVATSLISCGQCGCYSKIMHSHRMIPVHVKIYKYAYVQRSILRDFDVVDLLIYTQHQNQLAISSPIFNNSYTTPYAISIWKNK